MDYSPRFKPKPFTDIFTNDSAIDRSKCVRTVPMKVLILGLGRTGTACKYISFLTRSELLLFPFFDLISNPH